MIKRFQLFAAMYWEQGGGWHDNKHAPGFDTQQDAVTQAQSVDASTDKWWHVVDLETGSIVAANGGHS